MVYLNLGALKMPFLLVFMPFDSFPALSKFHHPKCFSSPLPPAIHEALSPFSYSDWVIESSRPIWQQHISRGTRIIGKGSPILKGKMRRCMCILLTGAGAT